MQVSLALSEAVVTALVTAQNFTVTVVFNGTTNTVNSSEVVDVFLAGLQDAVTPCARNVTSTSNATAGSTTYFENISSVRSAQPKSRSKCNPSSCYKPSLFFGTSLQYYTLTLKSPSLAMC